MSETWFRKGNESVMLPVVPHFPKDPYVMFEEIRKILCLSEDEFCAIFALLRKTCEGFLVFQVGGAIITLAIDTEKEITLEIEVRKERIENSVKFHFDAQHLKGIYGTG